MLGATSPVKVQDLKTIEMELGKLNKNVELLILLFEKALNVNPKEAPLAEHDKDGGPSYYSDIDAFTRETEDLARKVAAQRK